MNVCIPGENGMKCVVGSQTMYVDSFMIDQGTTASGNLGSGFVADIHDGAACKSFISQSGSRTLMCWKP